VSVQDWRKFLRMLESRRPGEIIREAGALSPEYEITGHIAQYKSKKTQPVILFENVKGKSFPLLTNLLASRERLAMALDADIDSLSKEYRSRSLGRIKPKVLPEAPFYSNRWEGPEVDLGSLPILTHDRTDSGAYLTGGLVVARDPVTGTETLGYHRMQYKGRNKLSISLHSRQRLWNYQQRAEKAGNNLQAAVVLGVHPVISMGSLLGMAEAESKFDAIGSLFGEPLEVAGCRDMDLLVPAWAEIVIEGEIISGVREKEGPFTEFAGSCGESTGNVFIAKSVSFRDKAVYQSITPGHGAEHANLVAVQREEELLEELGKKLSNIVNVHARVAADGLFDCWIAMRKTAPDQPARAIQAVFTMNDRIVDLVHKPPSRNVVVVDEDVNIFSEAEVAATVESVCGLIVDLDDERTRRGIDATRPPQPYLLFNTETVARNKKYCLP